jgi:glycosyltransferase involved in cell wall biosynthesis
MQAQQVTSSFATAYPAYPRLQYAQAVSVIIPTYNRAKLLSSTLDSVAAQTFRDYEIIIVDDGSVDDTAQQVATRTGPIRYIWQRNQGVSEARNHALRETHSEFVAFLDSDDLWQPNFLERAVAELRRRPDYALVFTDFISTDPRGRILRGHRKRPHAGRVTPQLFASTFIHTSAVVARSAIIRDAGGFDGRLTHNEDYDLWLRLSLRYPFGLIPEPLCLRRCHDDSLSHGGCSPDVLLRKADLLTRFYEGGGGKEFISDAQARSRLAKLYYSAGKALLRAGRRHDAWSALRRSLQIEPIRPKSWLWYLRTRAGRTSAPLAGAIREPQ